MSELPDLSPPSFPTNHRLLLPKSELPVADISSDEPPTKPLHSKVFVLADLNVDPPETEDEDLTGLVNDESNPENGIPTSKYMDTMEPEGKRMNPLGKCRSRISKAEYPLECGADADADQQCQGTPTTREERVNSLKTDLVHVARKMPKNAHAHFILGLMYQRLCQPQKAISVYEKAEEILLHCEDEIERPGLLSLVQIHHAQCRMLEILGDHGSEKELEPEELEEILSELSESMKLDVRRATVWNTLGLILLKTGRQQSAISVLSSLLTLVPDNLDCLGNLGIAYLQSGDLEHSEKCFQDLLLKDQGHPSALINYAAFLLSKYGSTIAGAGANAGDSASTDQIIATNVAKECLFAAIKTEPKSGHIWANLANAYSLVGDHISSGKCLEKAAKLEPNCMPSRYAIALHRIRDAERHQSCTEQLSWAGNEMASVIKEGDSALMDLPIAWAGFSMVHKAKHEIAATFDIGPDELVEMEEHAVQSLKQGIMEDPADAVQWHQLGHHSLCTSKFKMAQRYLKATIARLKECSYAWSNLGICLQVSEEARHAEEVLRRALSLSTPQEAHTIFSNLGVLYRQQKRYESAKAMFSKSLALHPGYAPAYNNLGLVFIAENQLEDAAFCFTKALQADPLLDAAKSNSIKLAAISTLCSDTGMHNSQT